MVTDPNPDSSNGSSKGIGSDNMTGMTDMTGMTGMTDIIHPIHPIHPKTINIVTNKSKLIILIIYVYTGSIYENVENNGISHLIEHLLMRESKNNSHEEMRKKFTILGGIYNGVTKRDMTYYYVSCHIDLYKECIDIIHDIVFKPLFNASTLDNEKQSVIQELYQYHMNNDDVKYNLYEEYFGNSSVYAFPITGTIRSLSSIENSDILEFYRQKYKYNFLVCSVDESKEKEVRSLIKSKFGIAKDLVLNSVLKQNPETFTPFNKIIVSKDTNYNVIMTFPGFPRKNIIDNIHLSFLNFCLVESGLSSIFLNELRYKEGLIYSISSSIESYNNTGLLKIFASSYKNNISIISQKIRDVLEKIKLNGVGVELETFKLGFFNRTKYLNLNDVYKTLSLGEKIFYGSYISFNQHLEVIKSITNDVVMLIAKKCFDPLRMGILTYGNFENQTHVQNLIKAFRYVRMR